MLPAITVYENLERLKNYKPQNRFYSKSQNYVLCHNFREIFFPLTPIGTTPHTDNQQFNKCTIFPSFMSALHYKMCLLLKDKKNYIGKQKYIYFKYNMILYEGIDI